MKRNAIDLMKLPYKERMKALEATAQEAENIYKDNLDLCEAVRKEAREKRAKRLATS